MLDIFEGRICLCSCLWCPHTVGFSHVLIYPTTIRSPSFLWSHIHSRSHLHKPPVTGRWHKHLRREMPLEDSVSASLSPQQPRWERAHTDAHPQTHTHTPISFTKPVLHTFPQLQNTKETLEQRGSLTPYLCTAVNDFPQSVCTNRSKIHTPGTFK